ncbi:MAG: sugar phosphate isomerase/epimerase [Planctomycetota bacterium]|nr:MAG: sugar phosphate isomerase/epimerase [Planctomycetota bacterium]
MIEPSRLCVAAAPLARDLRGAFRRARSLGVRGVELDARGDLDAARLSATGVRQIRKWLADEGLVVAALSFPTRGGYGDAERLESRIDGTKRALQLAHDLGASVVTNHVGAIPADDSPSWNLLLEALRDVGAWGERVGATLCAESGRAAPADLVRLFAALPEGAIGCTLVTGALVVHDHDPAAAVAALAGSIRHVHLTDAVAGSFAGHGRPAVLGRGQVDLVATLGALEERGYRGWLGLEPVDGHDPARELADSIGLLSGS